MSDFPWKKYTKDELFEDYIDLIIKLRETKVTFPILGVRVAGLKASNKFFQYRRMKTSTTTKSSSYEFWKDKKKKILDYHRKSKATGHLFNTIAFYESSTSSISPISSRTDL